MLSFLLVYFLLMFFSRLVVTMIEQDAAIGFVGTTATIDNVYVESKLPLIIDMLPVGRLELVPFLVMLSPEFWQFSSS
jgi:trk system potassium uptake protein TrkH